MIGTRDRRQASNLHGLEGTSPWSERGHGPPLSRRDRRPGNLLFPHHASLRDELRKVRLDEPHLLDRERLAWRQRTNARSFSGVVGVCPLLALSGHRLVRCKCPLMTQSGQDRFLRRNACDPHGSAAWSQGRAARGHFAGNLTLARSVPTTTLPV